MNGYELTLRLRKTRRRHRLSAPTQALYYELVAICNEEEWPDEFKCSNDELCTALQISEKSLILYRVELIESGLLFYQSGKSKKKIGNYSFTKDLVNGCKIYSQSGSPKGSQSGSPKGSQSGEILSDSNKTKTETELFVVIEKTERKIADITQLFEADVGLTMNWAQKGFAAAEFSDGVEQWMIQNNTAAYHDFTAARKHFLFWMPNFKIEPHEPAKKPSASNKTTRSGSYASGF